MYVAAARQQALRGGVGGERRAQLRKRPIRQRLNYQEQHLLAGRLPCGSCRWLHRGQAPRATAGRGCPGLGREAGSASEPVGGAGAARVGEGPRRLADHLPPRTSCARLPPGFKPRVPLRLLALRPS